MPTSNATRYARGEIWWFENRDDVKQLSTKIRACELNSAGAAKFTRRLGCFVQRTKLRARRTLMSTVKNWAQATARNYRDLRDALRGPSGTRRRRRRLSSLYTSLRIAVRVHSHRRRLGTTPQCDHHHRRRRQGRF